MTDSLARGSLVARCSLYRGDRISRQGLWSRPASTVRAAADDAHAVCLRAQHAHRERPGESGAALPSLHLNPYSAARSFSGAHQDGPPDRTAQAAAPTRIAVIGAGLAGLATAYHLIQRSTPARPVHVEVIDSEGIGGGASGVAAGARPALLRCRDCGSALCAPRFAALSADQFL